MTRDAKLLGANRGAGHQEKVEDGGNGGISMDAQKGEHTGANRNTCHIEGGKGGANEWR